jgi:hypothetical protein
MGRAKRFIHTMLNESLYAVIYQNSEQRRVALAGWYRALQRTKTHGALEDRSQWTGHASSI